MFCPWGWMVSPCPCLSLWVFCHISCPLSSWGEEWQSGLVGTWHPSRVNSPRSFIERFSWQWSRGWNNFPPLHQTPCGQAETHQFQAAEERSLLCFLCCERCIWMSTGSSGKTLCNCAIPWQGSLAFPCGFQAKFLQVHDQFWASKQC